ncbi:MAG: hypothetical protein HF967_03715 [Methanosarcinales archaeon]|nr:hypothetical protein [Methanosarcinales archaeon]
MDAVIEFFIEDFIGIIIIISNIISFSIGRFKSKNIDVSMNIDIDETEEEKQKHAKKGIIIIISQYKKTKLMKEEDIKNALNQKKYEMFDLENSNLGHNIKSILTHSTKLKHCWIVGSYVKDSKSITSSSINFIEILIEYLKQEKNLQCTFHYGKQYAIPISNDALICKKSYKLTNDIFIEAKEDYNLIPKDIIVDVTGGTKSMNLGLILASLHKDKDLQIIGSDYDLNGDVIRDKSRSIRIHFSPKIKK